MAKIYPSYSYMCLIKFDNIIEDRRMRDYNLIDPKETEALKEFIKNLTPTLLNNLEYFEWYTLESFCTGINCEIFLEDNFHLIPFNGHEIKMLKVEITA